MIELNDRSLVEFLCRAKKATYAGKGAETDASRPLSHDLRYREGLLLYYDTYLGGERFSGEEALWRDGEPVWAMNYTGKVVDEGFSGDFLKDALSLVAPEMPFRGPLLYRSGEYCYVSRVSGGFDWFYGLEEIFRGTVKTYECLFHGGLVV